MDLQADGPVLSGHFSQAEGHGDLKKVTDCLWYLEVDKKLSGKLQEKEFVKCYNFPRGMCFVSICLHTLSNIHSNKFYLI